MGDYISREAFKKKYLYCGFLPEMSEEEFDSFPAADVEPVRHGRWVRTRWIPCSERLPESDEVWQKYIVVYSYRTFPWDGDDTVVTVADYNSEQKIWSLDNGEVINALITPENIQPKASYISHWRPLPEPPEEK